MHRPTNFFLVAASISFGVGSQVQARVLSNTTKTTTSTKASTVSTIPSSAPIVIAGACDQNTLQYCCPFVEPLPGQSSEDFATACMNGNLPASEYCFFEFDNICCQSTPDANGNSCEIVPPADICSPGAAGSIRDLGAIAGASTVAGTPLSCTASSSSASSTGANGSSTSSAASSITSQLGSTSKHSSTSKSKHNSTTKSSSISTKHSSTSKPTPASTTPTSTPTHSSSHSSSTTAPTTTPAPTYSKRGRGGWISDLGLSAKLSYQSQFADSISSLASQLGRTVVGCEIFDSGLVCGWEWFVTKTVGVGDCGEDVRTVLSGIGGGGGGWIEVPVTRIS